MEELAGEPLGQYLRRRYEAERCSVQDLARELTGGDVRTVLKTMRRLGVPVRPRGHQVKGLTKETSDLYDLHSLRMQVCNPSQLRHTQIARARGQALRSRRRPSASEKKLADLLAESHLTERWRLQMPWRGYVLDFAFPAVLLDVELDGKNHWNSDRRARDQKRDAFLTGEGWKVVRISTKRFESNPGKVLAEILALLADRQRDMVASNMPSRYPAPGAQEWVFWCG
jgi:very-short-patch-repair endonuclease